LISSSRYAENKDNRESGDSETITMSGEANSNHLEANINEQDKLVTIATFPEPMEANMARSALEAAGIPVFLVGETANSMIPVAFASQLQVQAKDEAAARGLLEAMNDAPESLESVTAAEIAAEDTAR
jgi:Putative prokaryotic signal transducing protein